MKSVDMLTDFEILHYESNIQMEIPMVVGKYRVDKLIYETANSVVVSAHSKTEKCAIKFIPIDNVENARKEALIMQQKKHLHIIKFLDSLDNEKFFAIVMAVASTDLTQYIKSKGFLTEEKAKKVMFDCFSAMIFLHTDGIWHLDIKSDNIFVMNDTDAGPNVVIGDFGLACSTEYEKIEGKPVGSLNYAAPETIQIDYSQCFECSFLEEATYTKKVDSWCLGEIMYFILSGFEPFMLGENDGIRHCDGEVTFDIPEHLLDKYEGENPFDNVSEEAKDLICRLICADPDERLSISEAKKHEWFDDFSVNENKTDYTEELDEVLPPH